MTENELLESSFYNITTRTQVVTYDNVKEFINTNVCIQKGANRHLSAKVLHAWIEGAEIEAPKTAFLELGYETIPTAIKYLNDKEYRIKPKLFHEQWKSLYDQGIELEVNNKNVNNYWFSLDSSALSFNDVAYQYRIKPKEPIFEWQWYSYTNRVYLSKECRPFKEYMTEDEIFKCDSKGEVFYGTEWHKLEETKRERK